MSDDKTTDWRLIDGRQPTRQSFQMHRVVHDGLSLVIEVHRLRGGQRLLPDERPGLVPWTTINVAPAVRREMRRRLRPEGATYSPASLGGWKTRKRGAKVWLTRWSAAEGRTLAVSVRFDELGLSDETIVRRAGRGRSASDG